MTVTTKRLRNHLQKKLHFLLSYSFWMMLQCNLLKLYSFLRYLKYSSDTCNNLAVFSKNVNCACQHVTKWRDNMFWIFTMLKNKRIRSSKWKYFIAFIKGDMRLGDVNYTVCKNTNTPLIARQMNSKYSTTYRRLLS